MLYWWRTNELGYVQIKDSKGARKVSVIVIRPLHTTILLRHLSCNGLFTVKWVWLNITGKKEKGVQIKCWPLYPIHTQCL